LYNIKIKPTIRTWADSLGCFRCRFELVYHSKSR